MQCLIAAVCPKFSCGDVTTIFRNVPNIVPQQADPYQVVLHTMDTTGGSHGYGKNFSQEMSQPAIYVVLNSLVASPMDTSGLGTKRGTDSDLVDDFCL